MRGDPKAEEERIDAEVLSLLLGSDDQRPWAVEEVEREFGNKLAVTDSLDRLYAAGLVHRMRGLCSPLALPCGARRFSGNVEAAMPSEDEPTQKTQPKTDAEPADIPVPTRERVLGDLGKVAPKVEPGDEPGDD